MSDNPSKLTQLLKSLPDDEYDKFVDAFDAEKQRRDDGSFARSLTQMSDNDFAKARRQMEAEALAKANVK